MIDIKENFQLKEYNTFGVNASCTYFLEFFNSAEIISFFKNNKYKNLPHLVIGGGSNILFTKNFEGVVYHPNIKGIKIINETDEHLFIEVGAGEVWDKFVEFCVNNNYSGIENLSLIPGNIGASPVQNIGAYGVEVKDVIEKVHAVEIENGSIKYFSNADCEFNYRNSIFKNTLKNKYIITHVTFKLNKKHNFITHYGNVNEELNKFKEINLKTIRQAIINIRERKLPDYKKIGNAGSFFKNPIVENKIVEKIKIEFTPAPVYPIDNKTSKLAAGWLIDMCGWKGKQIGNVGVHKDQALIIINIGNATGTEIMELSNKIRASVLKKFNVKIEPEVNIY